MRRFCDVDTKTRSLPYIYPSTNRTDDIIELAAVSTNDGKIGSAFQTYVQTNIPKK